MKALMYPVYGDPVDFENISSLVPDISVIAHALALQNRWHGNTKYYWSVANHCIHAVEIFKHSFEFFNVKEFSPAYRYVMLRLFLHDAGEAYTGDINTYIKHASPEISEICDAVQAHVENHFVPLVTDFSNTLGIYYSDVDHIVHTVDKLCGWAEVHAIANEKCPLYNFVEDVLPEWVLNDALLRLWNIITDCDTPAYSEIRYKTMFSGLNRAVIDAVEDKR